MEMSCVLLAFVASVIAFFVIAAIFDSFKKPVSVKEAHVLITGGSSGIGKEVAREALRQGAKVTLVARNVKKLEETLDELRNESKSSHIKIASIDVSAGTCQDIRSKLQEAIETLGPVKVLIHCAGFSVPGRAHQVLEDDVKKMVDVNYLGSVKVTQALLPEMINQRNGAIIFTSSVAGLVGVYGLAPYCGSKFAIRGYAEALAMELGPYGITVSVNCPPDTDTPGLEAEAATKPEETKLISEGAGLFQPDEVANLFPRTLLNEGLRGKFLTSNGLDGWLATQLNIGMAHSSLKDLLVQIGLLGLMRLIIFGYLQYFRYLISKCHKKRESTKKRD